MLSRQKLSTETSRTKSNSPGYSCVSEVSLQCPQRHEQYSGMPARGESTRRGETRKVTRLENYGLYCYQGTWDGLKEFSVVDDPVHLEPQFDLDRAKFRVKSNL